MASAVRGRLLGLAALLVLLALLLGIPAGLLAAAGNPIAQLPQWQDLLRPDDGSLFLTVLVLVGWAAWATFAVSVLVETAAAARGRPVRHLPALQLQQRAAAGLVSTAALLFSLGGHAAAATPALAAALPGLHPLAAAAAPARNAVDLTHTIPAADGEAASSAAAAPAAAAPASSGTARTHTVIEGESLWSIAEHELGDGARYQEIARLNYGARQPDGSHLDSGHWIRPGWILTLPATATRATPAGAGEQHPEHTRTVRGGDTLTGIAVDEYGDPRRYVDIARASSGITQPGGARLTDPDVIDVGWTLRIPATSSDDPTSDSVRSAGDAARPGAPNVQPPAGSPHPGGAPTRPATSSPASPSASRTPTTPTSAAPEHSAATAEPTPTTSAARPAGREEEFEQGFPVRTTAGIGSLLAAGVLGLLAARRTAQQRRRRPGHAIPLPDGESATAEQELRVTGDPLSVETVDLALRTLAAHCTRTQQPLPVVRAARLTAEQFDLYLAEPATLPAPWSGTADATVWTMPSGVDGLLDPAQAVAVPAPYPSLVTIGHDQDDGHVLLDLEHLGALGISGDPEATREVLAAVAAELATSRWADDLQVTLVGAYPELGDALQTGRIRYLPTVGHLLDQLTARANGDRSILAEEGAADLNTARAAGSAPDVWTPEIVVLAGEITSAQRRQLEELIAQLPRVAIAAVTSGQPLGEWLIRLDGDAAVLDPVGLQIRPQRIDDATYSRVLDVLAVAGVDDDEDRDPLAPEPTPPTAGSSRIDVAEPATPPATSVDPSATAANTSAEDATAAAGSGGSGPAKQPGPTSGDERLTTTDEHQPANRPVDDEPPEQLQDEAPQTSGGGTGRRGEMTGAATGAPNEADPLEHLTARPAPRILVLGPVELTDTHGPLPQASHAARYRELAAILALNPGVDVKNIRDAYFMHGRRYEDKAVHQAISRLRRWLGAEEFLPKNPPGGRYHLGPAVTSDWQDWHTLLPNGPAGAPSEALEQALALVRQRPFYGADPRYYAWAEHDTQRMVSQIVDAAYELAQRQLREGRHRAVIETTAKGLLVEPGMERLWRLRVLAAHASGNPEAEQDATARLLAITSELGGDLEPETTELLAQLRDPATARVDHLAQAL